MSFNKYKKRRVIAKILLVLPVLVVAAPQIPFVTGKTLPNDLKMQYSTLENNGTSQNDAEQILFTELDSAKKKFIPATGFTQVKTDSRVEAATSKTSIVLTISTGDNCYFLGFIPGESTKVISDPTGSACTSKSIRELQVALRAQDGNIISNSQEKAKIEIDKIASQAQYAYLGKLGNSFNGVSKVLNLPTQQVIESKEALTVRSISTGLCWMVTVTPREVSQLKPCN
jgi:hypothetical protein